MTKKEYKEFRVRNIPDKLYKQFKIISVIRGITVNNLFIEAMEKIVIKENNSLQNENQRRDV